MDNGAQELRAVAEELAAEAAAFVRRRRAEIFGTDTGTGGPALRSKSSPTDPVTIADTETEQLIRNRLAELRPGESILGEEGGGAQQRRGAVRWVVDPIDGTVNFVYGIPTYAVSIAAQLDGRSVAGAVADVASGDVYSAGIGLGAHLLTDGARQRLRCSDVDDLSMALLGTGFGYQAHRRAAQAELLARMLPVIRDVRRIGSAALDLCMVAAGRLDGHYEHGLNVWDWAAGALVAAEAGAVLLLPDPDESGIQGSLVVVAAPGVATQLIDALVRFDGLRPLP
ncbi:MAG: inositol monophosphatase family protein [Mycobacterium sp.]|nr:inositol monophosphatase family protein [Mycobacterium sp.]